MPCYTPISVKAIRILVISSVFLTGTFQPITKDPTKSRQHQNTMHIDQKLISEGLPSYYVLSSRVLENMGSTLAMKQKDAANPSVAFAKELTNYFVKQNSGNNKQTFSQLQGNLRTTFTTPFNLMDKHSNAEHKGEKHTLNSNPQQPYIEKPNPLKESSIHKSQLGHQATIRKDHIINKSQLRNHVFNKSRNKALRPLSSPENFKANSVNNFDISILNRRHSPYSKTLSSSSSKWSISNKDLIRYFTNARQRRRRRSLQISNKKNYHAQIAYNKHPGIILQSKPLNSNLNERANPLPKILQGSNLLKENFSIENFISNSVPIYTESKTNQPIEKSFKDSKLNGSTEAKLNSKSDQLSTNSNNRMPFNGWDTRIEQKPDFPTKTVRTQSTKVNSSQITKNFSLETHSLMAEQAIADLEISNTGEQFILSHLHNNSQKEFESTKLNSSLPRNLNSNISLINYSTENSFAYYEQNSTDKTNNQIVDLPGVESFSTSESNEIADSPKMRTERDIENVQSNYFSAGVGIKNENIKNLKQETNKFEYNITESLKLINGNIILDENMTSVVNVNNKQEENEMHTKRNISDTNTIVNETETSINRYDVRNVKEDNSTENPEYKKKGMNGENITFTKNNFQNNTRHKIGIETTLDRRISRDRNLKSSSTTSTNDTFSINIQSNSGSEFPHSFSLSSYPKRTFSPQETTTDNLVNASSIIFGTLIPEAVDNHTLKNIPLFNIYGYSSPNPIDLYKKGDTEFQSDIPHKKDTYSQSAISFPPIQQNTNPRIATSIPNDSHDNDGILQTPTPAAINSLFKGTHIVENNKNGKIEKMDNYSRNAIPIPSIEQSIDPQIKTPISHKPRVNDKIQTPTPVTINSLLEGTLITENDKNSETENTNEYDDTAISNEIYEDEAKRRIARSSEASIGTNSQVKVDINVNVNISEEASNSLKVNTNKDLLITNLPDIVPKIPKFDISPMIPLNTEKAPKLPNDPMLNEIETTKPELPLKLPNFEPTNTVENKIIDSTTDRYLNSNTDIIKSMEAETDNLHITTEDVEAEPRTSLPVTITTPSEALTENIDKFKGTTVARDSEIENGVTISSESSITFNPGIKTNVYETTNMDSHVRLSGPSIMNTNDFSTSSSGQESKSSILNISSPLPSNTESYNPDKIEIKPVISEVPIFESPNITEQQSSPLTTQQYPNINQNINKSAEDKTNIPRTTIDDIQVKPEFKTSTSTIQSTTKIHPSKNTEGSESGNIDEYESTEISKVENEVEIRVIRSSESSITTNDDVKISNDKEINMNLDAMPSNISITDTNDDFPTTSITKTESRSQIPDTTLPANLEETFVPQNPNSSRIETKPVTPELFVSKPTDITKRQFSIFSTKEYSDDNNDIDKFMEERLDISSTSIDDFKTKFNLQTSTPMSVIRPPERTQLAESTESSMEKENDEYVGTTISKNDYEEEVKNRVIRSSEPSINAGIRNDVAMNTDSETKLPNTSTINNSISDIPPAASLTEPISPINDISSSNIKSTTFSAFSNSIQIKTESATLNYSNTESLDTSERQFSLFNTQEYSNRNNNNTKVETGIPFFATDKAQVDDLELKASIPVTTIQSSVGTHLVENTKNIERDEYGNTTVPEGEVKVRVVRSSEPSIKINAGIKTDGGITANADLDVKFSNVSLISTNNSISITNPFGNQPQFPIPIIPLTLPPNTIKTSAFATTLNPAQLEIKPITTELSIPKSTNNIEPENIPPTENELPDSNVNIDTPIERTTSLNDKADVTEITISLLNTEENTDQNVQIPTTEISQNEIKLQTASVETIGPPSTQANTNLDGITSTVTEEPFAVEKTTLEKTADEKNVVEKTTVVFTLPTERRITETTPKIDDESSTINSANEVATSTTNSVKEAETLTTNKVTETETSTANNVNEAKTTYQAISTTIDGKDEKFTTEKQIDLPTKIIPDTTERQMDISTKAVEITTEEQMEISLTTAPSTSEKGTTLTTVPSVSEKRTILTTVSSTAEKRAVVSPEIPSIKPLTSVPEITPPVLTSTQSSETVPAETTTSSEEVLNPSVASIPFQFTIDADYDALVGDRKLEFEKNMANQLGVIMRLPFECIKELKVTKGSIDVTFNIVPSAEHKHMADDKAIQAAADELKRLIDTGKLNLNDLDGNTMVVVPIDPPTSPPVQTAENTSLILGVIIAVFVVMVIMVIIAAIMIKRKSNFGKRLSPIEEANSKLPSYRDIPFQEALFKNGSGSGRGVQSVGKYCYNSGQWLGPGPEPRLCKTPSPVCYKPPTENELRRTPRPPTAVRERLRNRWDLDWDSTVFTH